MKCSKCGKSFRDIKAIGMHYRKAHPSAMKARKPRKTGKMSTGVSAVLEFEASAKRLEALGYKVYYRIE